MLEQIKHHAYYRTGNYRNEGFYFAVKLCQRLCHSCRRKKRQRRTKKTRLFKKVLEFHRFGGMINFTDSVVKYKKIIILFDRDRKGRQLTKKTSELLQRRARIDLSYKRNLHTITKGKIRFIEQLICYEPFLA